MLFRSVLEARLAENLGVAAVGTSDAIESILLRAGLPVVPPRDLAAGDILAATRLDKKARAGTVEYALPERIGAMADNGHAWSIAVDDAAVRAVLA